MDSRASDRLPGDVPRKEVLCAIKLQLQAGVWFAVELNAFCAQR